MNSIKFSFCLFFLSLTCVLAKSQNASVEYSMIDIDKPIITGNIYAADKVWCDKYGISPSGRKVHYYNETDKALYLEFTFAPLDYYNLVVDEISFHLRTREYSAEFEVRFLLHSNSQETIIGGSLFDNSKDAIFTFSDLNITVPCQDTLYIRLYPFKEVSDTNLHHETYTTDFNLKAFTQLTSPPAAISYSKNNWCIGEDSAIPEITGDSEGTFSSTSGLVIDPSTGAIDINNSSPGNYTVSYTIANGFIATSEIIIDETPECIISGVDKVCPSTFQTYTAPEGMENYTWAVTGNASIVGNNNEQMVTLETGTSCSTTFELSLTIQKESGCNNTCSKQVIISEPDPLELTVPDDLYTLPCDECENLEEEFEEWLNQATMYGGCNSSLHLSTEGDIPIVPPECGNSITLIWTASGDCGSEISKTATFTVPDQKPIIVLNGNEEVILCLNDSYIEPGATIVNNPELDDRLIIDGEVDTSVPGVYHIKYNITDDLGLAADEVVRTVIVNEMPAAYLRGSGCSNGETELFVSLKGIAPWNFIWTDGENEFHERTSISPVKISTPLTANTISIISVTDATGCTNNNITEAVVLSGPVTSLPELTSCPDTEITIPITVQNLNEVRDISLTLEYDRYTMQYTGYEIVDLEITEGLMINDVAQKESNIIRISYSGAYNLNSQEDRVVLLNLKFHYSGGSTLLKWINEEDEDCEYSYSLVTNDTEFDFEYGTFCDNPSEEYYINGSVTQLPGCGTQIMSIPDISTLTNSPAIIPVIVDFPSINEEEVGPEVITSIKLISNTAEFPTGTRINDIRQNGISILNTPYNIGGKTEIRLNDIPGIEATPLINYSDQQVEWKIFIDGIITPVVLSADAEIIVYNNLQEPTTLNSKTFTINFNNNTLEVPESVTVCSDEPIVLDANFEFPLIENLSPEIKTDGIIKSNAFFTAGTIINWSHKADQGSYIFEKDTSTITFSSLLNESPKPLQDYSGMEEWHFEINNHRLQSEALLAIEGIAKLADTTYTFVSENITVIVHQQPEVELFINGESFSTGSETSFCNDDLISIELGNLIYGTGPIDIEWEVYMTDSNIPDATLSGSATNVSSGFSFLNSKLNQGIYNFKITNLTDYNSCSALEADLFSATITINHLPEVIITSNKTICNGTATGSIIFTPSDENSSYNYSLEPGGYLVENHTGACTFQGLVAGEYSYNITEAESDCNLTGIVLIEESEAIHLTGNVRYYHQVNYPLDNVTIEIREPSTGDLKTSAITDQEGNYSFENICPGHYEVTFSTNLRTGGINTTDAGQVNAWNISRTEENYPAIEKVRFLAGDVITEAVGEDLRINANDASLIQEHFVTFGNPSIAFDNNWEFWKTGETVNSQPQPDQNMVIEITNEQPEFIINFFGLVNGDFNSSYINTDGLKSSTVSGCNIILNEGEKITVTNDTIIEIPIKVIHPINVGAMSLIFNYPQDDVFIEDVYLNDRLNNEVFYNTSGDLLRISWYSENPLNLTNGDTLINISVRTNAGGNSNNSLFLKLINDPLVELADESYNVIPEAAFNMNGIKIESSAKTDLLLKCYPNPYNDQATIEYVLPDEGNVFMEVVGMHGNRVGILVNETQNAGKHNILLNNIQFNPGVYQLTIRFTDLDGNQIHQSIRIIKN